MLATTTASVLRWPSSTSLRGSNGYAKVEAIRSDSMAVMMAIVVAAATESVVTARRIPVPARTRARSAGPGIAASMSLLSFFPEDLASDVVIAITAIDRWLRRRHRDYSHRSMVAIAAID